MRKVVYNEGDEENISLLQIRTLKKSSTNIDNITSNESIECGDVEFNFRKKFKNHGFFIGPVSEILHRKGKNRRVLYCDGEEEDLSLKSIQTLLRLYPLPPPYLIREDPEILIEKIPVMNNTINFMSQNIHSLRNDIKKVNIDIIIDIMPRKNIDAYCIQET